MSRADKQQFVHDTLLDYRDTYGSEDFKEFLVAVSKYVAAAPPRRTEEQKNEEAPNEQTTDEYRTPTKKKKRPRREEEPSDKTTISTQNRYQVFTDNEDDLEMDNTDPQPLTNDDVTNTQTKTKKADIPKPQTAKVTPLIIREKTKWTEISKIMTNKGISYTKAKLVKAGIQVTPATENDYRQTYKLLQTLKIQFYTYTLNADKTIKVVLRGVIQEVTDEDVKTDLTDKGFEVLKVVRMKGKTGPAPLVLVEVPREYNSIYKITRCCNLTITTEKPNARPGIVQCHRCQLFGHVQRHCHSNYRCLKCGESHSTHECTKPKTTDAKCANCGQNHVSSSPNCDKNPNKRNPPPPKTDTKRAWTEVVKKHTETKTTTTQPTTQKKETPAPPPKRQETDETEKELHTTLGEMLAAFAETNATDDQLRQFVNGTKRVIRLFKTKTYGI